ncbi:hypothetical protein GF323_05130 [Candidatus Woesearchaeota archaeon]|nr:hypothetical protein [Candidatus Woesearchaeota archaeon]
MKAKSITWMLSIFLIIPFALAEDLEISVNQSEYYFLIGEEAAVPIGVENTYDKAVSGMFRYTITQEINQGGFHYSSSNTQSKSYTFQEGSQKLNIGFGSSAQPMTLRVSIGFTYTEKEERIVELDEILIHFVKEESQKQNQQNRQKSSSEKVQEQQQSQQQKSIARQMQEGFDRMFNKQQQQNAQQRVQNNQLSQDSAALRQQMQQQMQQQQEMKEQFEKNLADNEEFQEHHKQLLQQGYNLSLAGLDPTNFTSGNFEFSYEKEGKKASLKGNMENNKIKAIEKTSTEDSRRIMEKLRKDEKFQEYDSGLKKEQFTQQQPEITQLGNKTHVKLQYQNPDNKTAIITAEIQENEVREVKLEREKNHSLLWLIAAALFLMLSYLAYRKYRKKPQIGAQPTEKPIDYRKEAGKLLEQAKELFKGRKEKDAYAKAAEAIRFYYRYKLGLKKEFTNSELIACLKKHRIKYAHTQKCLNLCSLVEFAKYKANKGEFDEIMSLAEKIIS